MSLTNDLTTAKTKLNKVSEYDAAMEAAVVAHEARLAKLSTDPQVVAAAGATAVSLTTRSTVYNGEAATDDITSALADGTFPGQRKSLTLIAKTTGKTAVITPAKMFPVGAEITLSEVGDSVELEWCKTDDTWLAVHVTGTATVAVPV